MSEDEARRAANEEPTDDDVEAHARKAMNEEAGDDADDGDDVEAHARRSG
jgi:hypothetical protein